jgi:galactokinase
MGSGLSSSAALEVSLYTFLENLTKKFSNQQDKALACQKAEHEYAFVPCGIMDQFICSMGLKGHALLIDCKSYETTPFPLNDPNVVFLVTNSNVKHQLEGSEYSERRKQCEKVVKSMNKSSMRDANLDDLEAAKNSLENLDFKRGRHAISEIRRTLDATKALKENDLNTLGALMNESHDSLRDDFDVSCKELNELVEIARQTTGVYGSRMTGGGFGGCTVTLVSKANVQDLIENIRSKYSGKPSFYVCSPCEGARKILL